DAEQASLLARICLLRAELFVTGSVGGRVQAFNETRLVPDDAGRNPIWEFVGTNEVAAPDLKGIKAERPGAEIHQAFGDEGRDRPADTAMGPGRRLAGGDAADRATIRADLVGPRKEAHDLNRLQPARPWIDRIGTDIADDISLQRRRDAVGV